MALSQRHMVPPDRLAGKRGLVRGVVPVEEEEPYGRPSERRARPFVNPTHWVTAPTPYQLTNRQARVGATTSGIGSGGES